MQLLNPGTQRRTLDRLLPLAALACAVLVAGQAQAGEGYVSTPGYEGDIAWF